MIKMGKTKVKEEERTEREGEAGSEGIDAGEEKA